jgi:replicative DNA helicase
MPSNRELIILFGYMSSGKTEYAYFALRKNAEKGIKVMFISLELPEYDMKLRIARKRAGVSKFDFQSKNYNENQKKLMNDEFRKIDKQPNLLITSPTDKSL